MWLYYSFNMSTALCQHQLMIDSTQISRYGSATRFETPTRIFSASSAEAVIAGQTTKVTSSVSSVICPKVQRSSASMVVQSRTCALPEIPISLSWRSTASSNASPLLIQTRKVNEILQSEDHAYMQRRSVFPNFRALQRLALSAKAHNVAEAHQNLSTTTLDHPGQNHSKKSNGIDPETRTSNIVDKRKVVTLQMTTGTTSTSSSSYQNEITEPHKGCSSVASLPGNRNENTCDSLNSLKTDNKMPSKDHTLSSRSRRKKKTKNKTTQAKSRGYQRSHKKKSDSNRKSLKDRKGSLIDENSLGSLLLAMPVVVEPKKIEIYSSRYSKFEENQWSHSDRIYSNISHVRGTSLRKELPAKSASLTIKTCSLEGMSDQEPVVYASRTSPLISGEVDGVSTEKNESSKVIKVFLSEKQSNNLRECGCMLPCAPPGTPTPQTLQRYQYVPSMADLRSQRAVRERLSGLEEKFKKKIRHQKEEARKTEQQLQRDQIVALKHRQRLEIYALNKIMTDFEKKNFEELMTKMSEFRP